MNYRYLILGVVLGVVIVAIVIIAVALYYYNTPTRVAINNTSTTREVTVYVAPTLRVLVSDLGNRTGYSVKMEVLGSNAALSLIRSGKVPDAYFSVDAVLIPYISNLSLTIIKLGRFKLAYVCREPTRINEMVERKWALANPNTAPIGYRALVAAYLIDREYGTNLTGLFETTGIRYIVNSSGVYVDASRSIASSSRVIVRDNLDQTASALQSGLVDCIFAHTAYIKSVNMSGYYIYVFNGTLAFDHNETIYSIFRIIQRSGTILRVAPFEAFAAAFTQSGVDFLRGLGTMDLSKYGLEK